MTKKSKKGFVKTHLHKKLIKNEWVALHDIPYLLKISKKDFNELLGFIMQWFWDKEAHIKKDFLVYIPALSELCKYNYLNDPSSYQVHSLTREAMRSLMLPSGILQNHNYQRYPINTNDLFEFIDTDEGAYEHFKKRTWDYYQRIIRKLNNSFKASLLPEDTDIGKKIIEVSKGLPLNPFYQKYGKPILKKESHFHPAIMIESMGGDQYYPLLVMSSLCIRFEDLVGLINGHQWDKVSSSDLGIMTGCLRDMHPKDCTRKLINNNTRVDTQIIEYLYAKLFLEDKVRNKHIMEGAGSKDLDVKERSKISIAREIAERLSVNGMKYKPSYILTIMNKLRCGPMIGGIRVEKGPEEKDKILTLSEVQELLTTLINNTKPER